MLCQGFLAPLALLVGLCPFVSTLGSQPLPKLDSRLAVPVRRFLGRGPSRLSGAPAGLGEGLQMAEMSILVPLLGHGVSGDCGVASTAGSPMEVACRRSSASACGALRGLFRDLAPPLVPAVLACLSLTDLVDLQFLGSPFSSPLPSGWYRLFPIFATKS